MSEITLYYILQILNQTFRRVDQSATWLTASWFVGELSCYRQVTRVKYRHLSTLHTQAITS